MQRKHKITLMCAAVMIVLAAALSLVMKLREDNRVVRIGIIHVGDESTPYTANFIKAQEAIKEKYGDRVELLVHYNIPEGTHIPALKQLINDGCELIFTTSYGYGNDTKAIAKDYPNIQFCQATCSNANEGEKVSNYHTFMGAIHQGRYISGIIAGMKLKELIDNGALMSDQAKIGYVGAYPYPEVISGYTAFFLGVREIVPQATMIVKYTNTWGNYVIEKRIAKELINEGCVLISQHSDTEGPAVACESADHNRIVFHVGYNVSMIDVAPTTSLVSTRINWAPYMLAAVDAVIRRKTIEDVVKGHSIGTDTGAGFDENWVDLIGLNDVITAPNSKQVMEEKIEDFKQGKIQVFRGNYLGTNPQNPDDRIDLLKGYKECAKASAPSFGYVLDDVIKIERSHEKNTF